VYLVGMPGSGKSSAGRALAEMLGLPFVDLDDEIERAAGRSIPEIFQEQGEPRFRELEREALERAASGPRCVVACGGGVPLREDNRALMRSTGTVVALDVPVKRLWTRVAAGMRAYPDLIRGPIATDTRLMKALPGWIAKGGAEGLLCAAGNGIGVALKAEDGNGRGLGPAAAAFFRQLDLDLGDLAVVPLENSRGEFVGEITI